MKKKEIIDYVDSLEDKKKLDLITAFIEGLQRSDRKQNAKGKK